MSKPTPATPKAATLPPPPPKAKRTDRLPALVAHLKAAMPDDNEAKAILHRVRKKLGLDFD